MCFVQCAGNDFVQDDTQEDDVVLPVARSHKDRDVDDLVGVVLFRQSCTVHVVP